MMSVVFVPGRANLIGEHTDYNAGLALPFALNLGVSVAVAPHQQASVLVIAEGFGSWRSDEEPTVGWQRLAKAVINATGATGLELRISSNLPLGAGLSSSAAYLSAMVLSLDAPGDLLEIALLVQRCEAVAGSDVGLLDQLATLGARNGCALLIDFANMQMDDVVVSDQIGLSLIDSGERRELSTSQYALRRAQCVAASQQLGGWSHATFSDIELLPDPVLRARARHVKSENQRVRDAVTALSSTDLQALGAIVSASHASLRDDFQVSTNGIDQLVKLILSQPGVHGARLVGGGFGGCVLVVHEPDAVISVPGRTQWRTVPAAGAFDLLGRSRVGIKR